jgi:hypothetical protein
MPHLSGKKSGSAQLDQLKRVYRVVHWVERSPEIAGIGKRQIEVDRWRLENDKLYIRIDLFLKKIISIYNLL